MKKTYNFYLVQPPEGAIFQAKVNDTVITAYKSGKVLFQGKSSQLEANKWLNESSVYQQLNKDVPYISDETVAIVKTSHIGSDESGTGDYFGPITVAAVYVKEEHLSDLVQIGIQDSKKIADPIVKKLAKEIITRAIPYALLTLENKKYNYLQRSGWSQGKMKAMLHHHAIRLLLDKISNQYFKGIVIDQFCTPNVYKQYLRSENEKPIENTYFETKAETVSVAVAAASILARARFLKELDRLSEKTGYPILKGASHEVDKLAAKIIHNKGEAMLNHCAKIHFANTKKAKYLVNKDLL